MARAIELPELGENVTEAEVISVLVSEGDEVKADQPLLELETDKATFELPSPTAGVVKSIRVSAGDSVEVGQVVVELDEVEEKGETREADDDAEESGADGEEAGEAEGDAERAEAREAEVKEDEKDAERSEPDADAEQGLDEETEEERAEGQAREEREPRERDRAASGKQVASPKAPAPAAPSVRRLARELGIDLERVEGTGPGGRLSGEDVKRYARELIEAGSARPRAPAPEELELPDFARFGEIERQPLSGIRRRTAENMARSWQTIPHVTQHDRADVTALEASRQRAAARIEASGAKLTLTAVVVKVAAAALRVFPKFNASLDLGHDEAIFKRYVNVGVAVDTEHGLLAPVIRGADQKSLIEIATELGQLSERARARKARPEDLQGSTFTVTNLGGLGTTTFAPLVRWPEVAVLGVGRASGELVPREGEAATRVVLPLSISYDHRWIDGADAARFLRWIAEALEHPLLLSLGA